MPYGFPSGGSLTNQICRELKDDQSVFTKDILFCGFEWTLIDEFRKHLELSFQPSIDAFLEHRPEYIEVGKTCIARALIPCEIEANLYRGIDRHWYEYLFNKLNTTPDKFGQNKLSILTFNYDRSLEQFLFIGLKQRFGLTDEDAASLVLSIPIVHLHGDLGKLKALYRDGRPYEPTVTIPIVKRCANDIKIIHENISSEEQFKVAHDLISQAETICFVGFGYHPMNLERLAVQDLRGKTLHGTAYQVHQSELDAVQSYFVSPIDLGPWDAIQLFWTRAVLK